MVVVWFFGFVLEPSKNWLMDLELWILPKWFCPSCVSCFQLLCGVGFIWSQRVTPRPTVLDCGQIKSNNNQQESHQQPQFSWLLMKLAYFLTIQLLHIQCSTPWVRISPNDRAAHLVCEITGCQDPCVPFFFWAQHRHAGGFAARFWWPSFFAKKRNVGTSIQWLLINKRYSNTDCLTKKLLITIGFLLLLLSFPLQFT